VAEEQKKEHQEDLEQKLKKDKWLRVIDIGAPLIGAVPMLYFAYNQFDYMIEMDGFQIRHGMEWTELLWQTVKDFRYMWYMLLCASATFITKDVLKHFFVKRSERYRDHKRKKKETLFSKLRQIKAEKGLAAAAVYPFQRFFGHFGTYLKLCDINLAGMFNREKQYCRLKELKDSGCDYFGLYKSMYSYHKKMEQDEEAALSLVELIKAVKKQKLWIDPLETKNNLFFRVINPFKKRDFFYHLENIFLIFVVEEYVDAFDEIGKRKKILTEDAEKSLLTSIVTDEFVQEAPFIGKSWTELSQELWQTAINQIYADGRVREERLADSLNTVKIFGPSRVLSSTLVIKENEDKEHLEEERRKIQELEEIVLDDPRYHVAEAVHLSDKPTDGKYVMIIRRKKGELLRDSKDIKAFEEAAEYLALIHQRLRSSKGERDYKATNDKRILESGFDFLKPLVNEWGFLFENIHGDYVFNKDAHGGNWIIGEDGVIAIDFEDRGMTKQEYDIVKLMDESSLFNKAGIDERIRVIERYMKAYGITDRDRFIKGYLNAVFPSAIGYFVYSNYFKYGDNKSRVNFLENARRSLYQIGTTEARKLEVYVDKAIMTLG
jgi:hypothetical protein